MDNLAIFETDWKVFLVLPTEERKWIIKPKSYIWLYDPVFHEFNEIVSFQELRVQKSYHEVTNFPQRFFYDSER